jgi:T-complex protein 1 subunit zeta
MIGRAATAQDDIVGDGTTSNVLFIGELMRQAERYIGEGLHPRVIVDGIEIAKKVTLEFLETFKIVKEEPSRDLLVDMAKCSLYTKIHPSIASQLTEIVVDAVLAIKKDDRIDLHMVEIMHMIHKMSTDSKLVRGIVMDHGARNMDGSRLENVYILCLNVSLEYEKTEVNSGFFWSNAEQREKLIQSERAWTDDKVQKIVDFKNKVCEGTNKTLIVLNQKGIDPPSLEILQKAGIAGIRRVKRRNAERIPLCCGGSCVNSVDDLQESDLGYADTVYEQSLGDDKFTFIEGVKNPKSVTILIKGPNDYSIAQYKDAIRDGLRAVKNTIEDKAVVPGGGAFEVAAYQHLMDFARTSVSGKAKIGVEAFA